MLSKAYKLEISSEDSKLWPDSLAPDDAEQSRREVPYILIWGWANFVTTATNIFFNALTYMCM